MSIAVDPEQIAVNYRYRKRLKRDRAKIAFACALCTIALGAGFGGYLYYGSYYAAGWHTHDNNTYYIDSKTMERVKGYQIIDNTCCLSLQLSQMIDDPVKIDLRKIRVRIPVQKHENSPPHSEIG